jgi:CubicO group peptidase (beta-lactamase class C family)
MSSEKIPDWVTYPGEEWVEITPEEAGLDVVAWRRLLSERNLRASSYMGQVHEDDDWGTVFTRGGYLVHTWGNGDYRSQTASMGKAFTWAVLGLAVERGLVDADEYIWKTWKGEGQLSHPHKHLDRGHHQTLTWNLLGRKVDGGHWGGFPLTNGYYWRQGAASGSVPEWADWTGDPFHDNYSHAEPGTKGCYSSGGQWRLAQALTALWGQDIKRVLDDELFGKIGIPGDHWDWTPGQAIYEKKDWYPGMPGYGDFLDPPYEIDGHVVRGGPGWVVMSAKDLARFGHLVATGGVWEDERLLGRPWTIGHGAGNGSGVAGESTNYTAFGIVTTEGIDFSNPFFPDEIFTCPIRLSG